MIRCTLAALLPLAALVPLTAQTVTTVLSNGTTDTRYDMVILGDGYQAHEQNRFNSDVNTFLTSLFNTQPYQTFASYYNVHTVFRASVDSGADHPDANPPIVKNTVYNASYNTGGTPRCLYIGNTSQALADAALAPATEGRVLVMVNDSRYGGCASQFAVSYNGSSMAQVQIHELGHSLGQLADEYDYPNSTYTGPEPSSVNITTSPQGQKWSHWWGTGGISSSAHQGAGYYRYGLYRPRNNCLMRSLGQPLCAVCAENIVKITNSVCQAIDTTTPATTTFQLTRGQQQSFAFTHYVPIANNPTISWLLNGQPISGATTTSYLLDTTGMSLGVHTVTCRIADNSSFVRLDPATLMEHEHTWTVNVADPTVAQLRLPTMTIQDLWVDPGETMTLDYSIINDGPATATFDIEFFLSQTTAWTPNDIYLGKVTINNLAATQQQVLQHVVDAPWRLGDGLHFITAVADRTNQVPELIENDNVRFVAILGTTGNCFTKLEYDDPLLYPHDVGSVSTGTGGTLHPTVVAPCATPGTLYLIAWGGSGTTPGTTLAPGTTIPLNQDFYTQLGLSLVNGPLFSAFFGTIDAQGLGRATFDLQPAVGLWPSNGHFAALLIDSSPAFAGTTNPIVISITP
ncbi:MAG: M64 family metallo-endopeptidase [bacterium]|nr:M64 family metallo-endopeptidase [bacterium]